MEIIQVLLGATYTILSLMAGLFSSCPSEFSEGKTRNIYISFTSHQVHGSFEEIVSTFSRFTYHRGIETLDVLLCIRFYKIVYFKGQRYERLAPVSFWFPPNVLSRSGLIRVPRTFRSERNVFKEETTW